VQFETIFHLTFGSERLSFLSMEELFYYKMLSLQFNACIFGTRWN